MTLEKLKEIAKETRLTNDRTSIKQTRNNEHSTEYALIDKDSGIQIVFTICNADNVVFRTKDVDDFFANYYNVKSWLDFLKIIENK